MYTRQNGYYRLLLVTLTYPWLPATTGPAFGLARRCLTFLVFRMKGHLFRNRLGCRFLDSDDSSRLLVYSKSRRWTQIKINKHTNQSKNISNSNQASKEPALAANMLRPRTLRKRDGLYSQQAAHEKDDNSNSHTQQHCDRLANSSFCDGHEQVVSDPERKHLPLIR